MTSETIATPIGPITFRSDGKSLIDLQFGGKDPLPAKSPIARKLADYFNGRIDAIDQIPVDETAGTPFQRKVWRALREIPAGETLSYAALAKKIGRPRAVRAVANANARNPIAVVVPCHRVIGSDDKLRGYLYGLERKAWLLAHEKKH
jgi:methylated-DNA-[protein]-cysteine S-methyltransferase